MRGDWRSDRVLPRSFAESSKRRTTTHPNSKNTATPAQARQRPTSPNFYTSTTHERRRTPQVTNPTAKYNVPCQLQLRPRTSFQFEQRITSNHKHDHKTLFHTTTNAVCFAKYLELSLCGRIQSSVYQSSIVWERNKKKEGSGPIPLHMVLSA